MEDGPRKKGFWLSKSKPNSTKLVQSNVGEREDVTEDVDFVESVDDKAIKSTKPVKKKEKELIIPMIATNRWLHARGPDELEKDDGNTPDFVITEVKQEVVMSGDSVTDQAVNEILRDVATDKSGGGSDSSFTVPLLLRNKVPDGYETDERMDVSLRPEQATDADYDAVPIEQYGKALLRGMGWKDGDGIGKNNRVAVKSKNKKKIATKKEKKMMNEKKITMNKKITLNKEEVLVNTINEKKTGSLALYKCPMCPKELTRMLGLFRHIVYVHGKMAESGQMYPFDESSLRPATNEDREYYYYRSRNKFEQLKRCEAITNDTDVCITAPKKMKMFCRRKGRSSSVENRKLSEVESFLEGEPDMSGPASSAGSIKGIGVPYSTRFKVDDETVCAVKCHSSNDIAIARTNKLGSVSGNTLTRVSKTPGESEVIKWTVVDNTGQEIAENWPLDSALLPASNEITPNSIKQITSGESSGASPTSMTQMTSISVPNKKYLNDHSKLNNKKFNMHGMMTRLVSLIREFPPPWNSDQLLESAQEIFSDVDVSILKMIVLSIVTTSRTCASHIMSSSLRKSLRQSLSEPMIRCEKVHLDEELTQSYIDSI